MRTFTQTFAGGENWVTNITGRHFRLLVTAGAVTVKLYKGGSAVSLGDMAALQAGLWASPAEGFDRVEIAITTAGAYQFGVSDGSSGYDRSNGDVAITNFNGAFTNTQKTVTSSSTSLVAANANRRYLLIQNNDASGIIYVTLDGTAATTAKGVKIAAGGSYELQGFVPTGQLFAIGSIASNANCVVVEG